MVYIPGVKFDGRLPEFGSFFRVDERFWKLPKNAQEITDGVRWAARDDVPVRVNGPTYLVSNLVEQPGKRRMMLHLVNYNAKKIGSLEAVEVICRLPRGQAAKEVRIYSPDLDGSRAIEMKSTALQVSFTVPVKTYTLAVIQW